MDQAELIEQMLSLRGTIGILKPGAGKGLAYQMASILQPGITLVVVPTKFIALDQEYSLAAMGIHQCGDFFESDEVLRQTRDSRMRLGSDILFLAADALPARFRVSIRRIFFFSHEFLSIRRGPLPERMESWISDRILEFSSQG